MVGEMRDKFSHMVPPDRMARTIAHQQELRAVPKYVRAAVKALRKYVDDRGSMIDAEIISPMSLGGPGDSGGHIVRVRGQGRRQMG